jgi:hypothetical protein
LTLQPENEAAEAKGPSANAGAFLVPSRRQAKGTTQMHANIETGAAIVKAPSDANLTRTELATVVRAKIQNCRKALSNALEHAINAGDVNHHNSGSAIGTLARDLAIVFSFAVQHGADPDAIRRAVCRNSQGQPLGPLGQALDIVLSEEVHRHEVRA